MLCHNEHEIMAFNTRIASARWGSMAGHRRRPMKSLLSTWQRSRRINAVFAYWPPGGGNGHVDFMPQHATRPRLCHAADYARCCRLAVIYDAAIAIVYLRASAAAAIFEPWLKNASMAPFSLFRHYATDTIIIVLPSGAFTLPP